MKLRWPLTFGLTSTVMRGSSDSVPEETAKAEEVKRADASRQGKMEKRIFAVCTSRD